GIPGPGKCSRTSRSRKRDAGDEQHPGGLEAAPAVRLASAEGGRPGERETRQCGQRPKRSRAGLPSREILVDRPEEEIAEHKAGQKNFTTANGKDGRRTACAPVNSWWIVQKKK